MFGLHINKYCFKSKPVTPDKFGYITYLYSCKKGSKYTLIYSLLPRSSILPLSCDARLSDGFSVGWAKAGMAILRDPDQKGMVGTLYPSTLHTPKGFGLGPLMAEI